VSQPKTASIASDLDLGTAFTLQFTALDPASGAVVAGVIVTNATLTVMNVAGGDLDNLLEQIDPLFIPVPIDSADTGG
jgi:hypothetical protein